VAAISFCSHSCALAVDTAIFTGLKKMACLTLPDSFAPEDII
jgi:hypothetical protein